MNDIVLHLSKNYFSNFKRRKSIIYFQNICDIIRSSPRFNDCFNYVLPKQIHAYRSLSLSDYTSHVFKGPFSMTCDTSMYICATDLGNLIGSVPGQVLFDRKSMHERKIQLGSLFICLLLYLLKKIYNIVY